MSVNLTMFPDPKPPKLEGIDLRCCGVDELLPVVRGANLVHADPPWSYDTGSFGDGAAAGHFACLDMQMIASHIAATSECTTDNAYLILWCTFPLLARWFAATGQKVGQWSYLTGGAWAKTHQGGVGYHWRGNSEIVLVYKQGRPKPQATISNLHISRRAEHSEKPVPFLRNMARAFCPPDGLVLELYAGLGSMARACHAEGRRYIGAEIDEERHRRALGLLAGRVGIE